MTKGDKYQIKNLVFSGGGVKGYSLLGVIQCLKDLSLDGDIECYTGSSIGSIVMLLLSLKYTPEELYSFVETENIFNRLKDFDFMSFLEMWGVESCKKMELLLKLFIKKKLGTPEATFADLYKYNPVKLTVVATHLNKFEAVAYNYEESPDEPLWLACRKSCSVPFAAQPVKVEKIIEKINDDGTTEQIKRTDCYVDGGIRNNFPIDLHPDIPETVGFLLENHSPQDFRTINNLEDYLSALYSCTSTAITSYKVDNIKKARIIEIDASQYGFQDMGLDLDKRIKLYKLGYDQTKEYFQKFLNDSKSKSSNDSKSD